MKKIIFLVLIFFYQFSFAQIWQPIEKTCAREGNIIAESFFGNNKTIEEVEQMPDQEALVFLESLMYSDLYPSFIIFNADSQYIADKVLRINYAKLLKEQCGFSPMDNSLANLLVESKKCSKTYFASLAKKKYTYANHQDQLEGPHSRYMEKLLEITSAIKKTVKIPLDSAINNLNGTLATLSPSYSLSSGYLVMTHEVMKISVEPKLIDLSKKLHFYLMDLIYDAAMTGKVKGKDIFDDLRLFFKQQNMSDEEARSLSFYYLGIFATRGASVFSSFKHLYPTSFSALLSLSMAISYLDKIAKLEGKNYVIPHQLKAKCHLAKPYHFWLAAFQSFHQIKQGQSKISSYLLPIIGGIGYDFMMTANGRDIRKLFKIKTPYDSYANTTRIDNWSRTLGSYFGKKQGLPKTIDADAMLIETFRKARMPKTEPKTTLGMIEEYFRIVRPEMMILRLSL